MEAVKKPNTNRKLLTRREKENMSDSTAESLTVCRSRKSLIEIPYYDDYVVAPYRVYFNVSTDQVIERLKNSIFPFTKSSLFMDSKIDLYGPLWVYFSLNVCIAIFGKLLAYGDVLHVHKLYKCYLVFAAYFFLIPLALSILFCLLSTNGYPGYAKLLAIYGYSFTVYIPAVALYLIPDEYARWTILGVAGVISLFCICKELIGTIVNNFETCKVIFFAILQCLLHAGFTYLLKYYFFA